MTAPTATPCPTCGAIPPISGVVFNPTTGTISGEAGEEKLSYMPAQMLSILAKRYPHCVAQSTLFDTLYGHDPNGGPDCNLIKVYAYRIRQALKPFGVELVVRYNFGYYLSAPITVLHPPKPDDVPGVL